MRAVIRLMVCVIVAASTNAALAAGGDEASGGGDRQGVQELGPHTDNSATTVMDVKDDDANLGAASGEPARSDSHAQADARARDQANALDEQRRQLEVWTSP